MKSLDFFPKASKAKAVAFDPRRYGCDVRKAIGVQSEHEGLLGLELELEGHRLPANIAGNVEGINWVPHNDGSLRNPDGTPGGGMEYVLSRPCAVEQARPLLDHLFNALRANRTEIVLSYRCSSHVHINMRGIKLNQLAAFVCLWGMFEDALTETCGEGRSGNLFALRLSDSSFAVTQWVNAFKTGDFLFHRDYRYLALNPACLNTFGSLEVRTMRGVDSADDLMPWIDALVRLRDRALTIENPTTLAMTYSGMGAVGLVDDIFEGLPILDSIKAVEGFETMIRDGFRRIQPLIYALPWDTVLPEINKVFIPNPFESMQPKPRIRIDEAFR